jgi:hypothetical protein
MQLLSVKRKKIKNEKTNQFKHFSNSIYAASETIILQLKPPAPRQKSIFFLITQS